MLSNMLALIAGLITGALAFSSLWSIIHDHAGMDLVDIGIECTVIAALFFVVGLTVAGAV